MNKTKNARFDVGASKRATETSKSCRIGSPSTNYFNTSQFYRQGIAQYLDVGRQHAVTATRLAEFLELNDIRRVTKLIECERRAGVPICASNDTNPGYYLAESAEELEAYISSLNRRSRHLQATILGLGFALDEMQGQGSLWDEENQRRM